MFDGYNRSGSGAVEIERLLCAGCWLGWLSSAGRNKDTWISGLYLACAGLRDEFVNHDLCR